MGYDTEAHLRSRGFNDELLDVINPAISDEVAVFYLYNLSGQLVGYQQYQPLKNKQKNNDPKDCRYYTYCKSNTVVIGGLETYHWSDVLYVVEGLFDAVPIWKRGLSCVFTCGQPSREVAKWLRLQLKPTVALLDPLFDHQDKKLRNAFINATDRVVKPEDVGLTVDLGDMTDAEVDLFLSLV